MMGTFEGILMAAVVAAVFYGGYRFAVWRKGKNEQEPMSEFPPSSGSSSSPNTQKK